MKTPTVTFAATTPRGRCPIDIGFNLLSDPQLFSIVQDKQVCIISDPVVAEHYLETLKATCLVNRAHEVKSILIPSGESHKTLQTAEMIWTYLLENHFARDAVLIALGGGVVGDVSGFAAACYLRGIKIIQCPTTLLAQIDSAIGGKTAVNHPLGKNLIGAFHSPEAVVIDLETLTTLPKDELRASLGELIKYAMILDESLFTWLENNIEALLKGSKEALYYAVTRACELKAKIVSQDEKEQGIRAILNFGHTIGHAIESLLDYNLWRHGEAVAVGMVVATHLSYQQGLIQKDVLERLIALLNRAKLPTNLPERITIDAIFARIRQDKKHSHQQLQWVLLQQLGKACSGKVVKPKELTDALAFCGVKE